MQEIGVLLLEGWLGGLGGLGPFDRGLSEFFIRRAEQEAVVERLQSVDVALALGTTPMHHQLVIGGEADFADAAAGVSAVATQRQDAISHTRLPAAFVACERPAGTVLVPLSEYWAKAVRRYRWLARISAPAWCAGPAHAARSDRAPALWACCRRRGAPRGRFLTPRDWRPRGRTPGGIARTGPGRRRTGGHP